MYAPAATGRAIPGATTIYRLEQNGSISVRQGDTDPYAYVIWHDTRLSVLGVRYLFMYPDGGVWLQAGDHDFYTIESDNIAYPIDWDRHEKRRKAPRG